MIWFLSVYTVILIIFNYNHIHALQFYNFMTFIKKMIENFETKKKAIV